MGAQTNECGKPGNGEASSDPPILTVGMPLYNEERWLRIALDSLLAQTWRNFTLVVSDNASTDGTSEICREYAARDSRVSYFRQPENKGALYNFRYVLDQARTPFFFFASGHDLWHPQFAEKLLPLLREDEETVLAFPQIQVLNLDGSEGQILDLDYDTSDIDRPIARYWHVRKNLYKCAFFYGIWRRETLAKCHFKTIPGPDMQILLEAALEGKFRQRPEMLMFYRCNRDEALKACINRAMSDLTARTFRITRFGKVWIRLRLAFVEYQRTIFQSDSIGPVRKVGLAAAVSLLNAAYLAKWMIDALLCSLLPSRMYAALKAFYMRHFKKRRP